MPKIRELLERDPRTTALANRGQARLGEAGAGERGDELRAELESFVCSGRFAEGLQRILDRFLAALDSPRQEAVWVSGFFGSGKSHLLKMLVHLWKNTQFEDGATARALVPGGLPADIRAAFTELDTRARRTGTPLAAASGTLLGETERVRAAVLAIVLRACGLPTGVQQARFCFWLREQGHLAPVRAAVEASGKPWHRELNSFLVSPKIAEALLEARPDLADGPKELRPLLASQFPPLSGDLTTDEFVDLAWKALSGGGPPEDGAQPKAEMRTKAEMRPAAEMRTKAKTLPLTVLVLDEAQQYIGESGNRSAVFTEVAEAIQTQFASRVALVASGQSALSQTPALQKLRDRFRNQIELTDADVEEVTRKVVLHKKASAAASIEAMFAAHEGEVSRHLRDTKIGARAEDRRTRVDDYPLLGVRRRFWEACLRAVDSGGVHSQLRSQLRILHDALSALADRELGALIPASDLFHALAPGLLGSGVLLNEIHTRIGKLADQGSEVGTEEGRLRRDLAALVFLIGKLPRETAVDLGVRADPPTLAELLLADLAADSGPFRKRVEGALSALAGERERVLMRVGGEYRLQTTEGAAWDSEFQRQTTAVRNDEAAIGAERDRLFGAALQETVAAIRLRHGAAKERRPLRLHRGAEPPPPGAEGVTVWLGDGWMGSEREFEEQARAAGTDDPTLHVHLPKRDGDALRDRIVAALSARRVLDHRGTPQSPEGREARAGMESRRSEAENGRDGIVRGLLREARVLQGGGNEISVGAGGLAEHIEKGARASLDRLYPRFAEGDGAAWSAAVKRAREQSERPFAPLGWEQDAADHPVAKEVMRTVGAGERGNRVQKALRVPPFGWPQDAVDAALIALHAAGRLQAARNGQPVAAGRLDQAGIKTTVFRPEQVVLAAAERIALRGLFQRAGISVPSGEEERGAREFLAALRALAARAGGSPPLPPVPDSSPPVSALLEDLGQRTGNDQLRAIHRHQKELEPLPEAWKALAGRAEPRQLAWKQVQELCRYAEDIHPERRSVVEETALELEAVRGRRSLLAETDPLAPLIAKLAAALRTELTALHRAFDDAVREADERLAADPHWTGLDPEERRKIRRAHHLFPPPPLEIPTDEDLLRTLGERRLSAWRAEADAVGPRLERALAEAAEKPAAAEKHAAAGNVTAPRTPEPDDPEALETAAAVPLRRTTLADEAAVRAWLRETETALLEGVRKGPVRVE